MEVKPCPLSGKGNNWPGLAASGERQGTNFLTASGKRQHDNTLNAYYYNKHRCGGLPYLLYAYGTSVLSAADQYTDSATVVLALSRGWHLSVPMAITFWASYLLQLVAGVAASGGGCEDMAPVAFNFVVGINPEVLATAPESNEGARAAGNALAVAKFCTESVPQSLFAVLLARDLSGAAQTVTYASVGLSLAIGLSGSRRLPRRFCPAF